MATWMVWTLAIPLIVIAASFFLLAIGLLLTLGRTVSILRDIEDKLHALNPLCRVVYKIGESVDNCCDSKHSRGIDIADIILSGIQLIRKWRKK